MSEPTARDLGEFGLIAAVTARFPSSSAVIIGPGDDAAVVAFPDGRVVATKDVLVEGVHFRRDWSSASDVGHKAAAASLADVAAMGGTATALLVGLAAPSDLPVAWVLGLADGLREESALVGACVVGGDTVSGPQVVVSVTALGVLGGQPVTRAGAHPGDLVVVAGRLGWAAAGLRLLQQGTATGPLVDAHRRPLPPYALGPVLAAAGATAMCDVSDGLVQDLGHISAASGVGIELESALLHDDAVAIEDVLHGGEDHALVATVAGPPPPGCRVVGRVVAGEGVRLDGRAVAGGWEHFR
ncbi:MAG TPA: thiamine-phosphate kinase [Mycobacteriales bacterium]|nr:thiamine-phosphate kinase [Mycobacteriales bacterium]